MKRPSFFTTLLTFAVVFTQLPRINTFIYLLLQGQYSRIHWGNFMICTVWFLILIIMSIHLIYYIKNKTCVLTRKEESIILIVMMCFILFILFHSVMNGIHTHNVVNIIFSIICQVVWLLLLALTVKVSLPLFLKQQTHK